MAHGQAFESRLTGARRRTGPRWIAVGWGRIVTGLIGLCAGGLVYSYSWRDADSPRWAVGGIAILVGALLMLSGIYARSRPVKAKRVIAVEEDPPLAREPLVPLLGALLVYKYQYITQSQLEEALAEQLESTPRRRLGEILVLRGTITLEQLEEALRFQHTYAHLDEAQTA